MNRLALHKLSYGIYVLTTKVDEIPYGCIINTAFQITSEPPRIAVSCNRDNFTNQKIKDSGKFAISVLAEDSDPAIISTFGYQSGRDTDKFSKLTYTAGEELGLPVFPADSVATLECRVIETLEAGTHTVFIGEAVSGDITRSDADEMTYRYYHEIRKGVAPKNAPTFIEPEKASANEPEKWKCAVCGYIYEDEKSFGDLPDEWVCPICGATKNLFNKL
jgi:flavin reductase (DIM6/NTAB) family NADH-FMN oxidoreductase RutF/rubredoxin